MTKRSVNAARFIEGEDAFLAQRTQPDRLCMLVLDNASIHRYRLVQVKRKNWLAQHLILYFLPPYSPHLNVIESFWQKVKYEWLPIGATLTFERLQRDINDTFSNVGTKSG